MKTSWFAFIFFVSLVSYTQNCPDTSLLTAAEFKQHISSEHIQLLDVRTKTEYFSGHIEDAVLADVLDNNQFLETIKTLDKDRPVYIYCRSGSRSKTAARLLCESGFNQVFDLKGGYLTWQ